MSRTALLQFRMEREQAACRGAVVAGAKGERGRNLDADIVDPHRIAVMRAMDEHAAGADGLQAIERGGDPVLLVDGREGR